MQVNDPKFLELVKHILSFEGGLSKDERDTAVKCAPFKGAYHTNKGITYCTFKDLAGKLNITNTYDRFTTLTDTDVAKFIYYFYKDVNGDRMPASIGLSITEAAWGSGKSRAIKNLQQALVNLGKLDSDEVDGVFGAITENAIRSVPEQILYNEFWKERQRFIDSLTAQPKYAMFKRGWQRRIDTFLGKFNISNIVSSSTQAVKKNPISSILVIVILGLIAYKIIKR